MSWFIQQDVNNGYPALYDWRSEWVTGWTANENIRYPDYTWRIKAGVNNNYPWVYPWFKETSHAEGEMVIGGSQTNYPNGFTSANRGGIRDSFNTDSMIGGNWGGGLADSTLTSALTNRAFAITSTKLNEVLASFNTNTTLIDNAPFISQFYGANIFDSILSCKVFPFDLTALNSISMFWSPHSVVSSSTATIKAFGRWDLAQNANLLDGTAGEYNFPPIMVTPMQAWEVENIDYSIYLPMSGIYPLDIRGECEVFITMNVDLIDGTGEYYVFIDRQFVGSYRALFAADVPVNSNQGRMQSNMLTNVVSSFGKAAGTLAGAALGGVGGSIVGQTIGSLLPTEHYAMETPSVGGLASMNCYGYPRVIAKVPKMFKDAVGYEEILGANRSATFVHLSECSGYVKCQNYKTDIIVATDTEKAEIERLMTDGVFI